MDAPYSNVPKYLWLTPLDCLTLGRTDDALFGVYDRAVKATHAGLWHDCSFGKLTLASNVDNKANDYAGSDNDIFYVDVPTICTSTMVSDPNSFCTQAYNLETACGTNEFYGWPNYALAEVNCLHFFFLALEGKNHPLLLFFLFSVLYPLQHVS